MSKKIKIIVATILLVLIVSPIVGYFLARASEPFEYSKKVIGTSTVVKDALGEVKEVKLAPFGYSVKYSGPQGWAEFETEIIGEKGHGTLQIKLEKNLGAWQVVGARLNGRQVNL